ncbi:hypothetical protein J6590_012037 [Homalodisca vitripennis]|nr:hypothetical protein J6590_012037 [Homalodisca vitripennis]
MAVGRKLSDFVPSWVERCHPFTPTHPFPRLAASAPPAEDNTLAQAATGGRAESRITPHNAIELPVSAKDAAVEVTLITPYRAIGI